MSLVKNNDWADSISHNIYWRSEEFEKLENYKNAVKPLINKEIARKNLLEFSDILDNHAVKHLLMYGTLLGAYRDHDFIPHDLDTDLIFFDLNGLLSALKSKQFRDLGFHVGRIQFAELISVHRDNEFIDLYLYSKLDETHHGMKNWKNVKITNDMLFPHAIIEFHGKRFRTIGKIQEYFELTYGNDWRIPQKDKHAEVK